MGDKISKLKQAYRDALEQSKMGKKGAASGVSKAMLAMLMMVIIVQLMVSFAPTMFEGLVNITGAPAWVGTVLPILIGAFLIFIIWAVVSKVAK